MTLQFDLADLFEKAFGYPSDAFKPNFDPVSGFTNKLRVQNGSAKGSAYYTSEYTANGVEYFMPIKIYYPTTVNPGGGGLLANVSGPASQLISWYLPYPVTSIQSKKTIIETPLTERRGTVKELINIEDFEIHIKGLIISETDDYPESDVTQLRNVYEANVALSIDCPLTDIFLMRPQNNASDQVVIKELRFPALKGVKNVVPYELLLVSDAPFNLNQIS